MAASSNSAVLSGLGSTFLSGRKRRQALSSARSVVLQSGGYRSRVVVAAEKNSWIPAVKGGGNFIDPEWLDGS